MRHLFHVLGSISNFAGFLFSIRSKMRAPICQLSPHSGWHRPQREELSRRGGHHGRSGERTRGRSRNPAQSRGKDNVHRRKGTVDSGHITL
jgi:hypothetical protein